MPEAQGSTIKFEGAEIQMHAVESSQIAAIGFNPEAQHLLVTFKGKNPHTYAYDNVTAELFEKFRSTPSPGQFFQQVIKPNVDLYPYIKVA
jgi:hypothetical protein